MAPPFSLRLCACLALLLGWRLVDRLRARAALRAL